MNIFGRFPTLQICLVGFGILVSVHHSQAATFQNQKVIETPDPYFKSPLQPIEVTSNPQPIPRSYNFQPAAVTPMPNSVQPSATPAPVRVASSPRVAPTRSSTPNMTKPIKGPVILAPLEPQGVWNAPKTPVTASAVPTNVVPTTPARFIAAPAAAAPAAAAPTTVQQRQPNAPQKPANDFNGFSAAPVSPQNTPGSATRSAAIAPTRTIQSPSQAVTSPLVTPKSIIREQQPAPFQLNLSPPTQTSPSNSFPAQPIQNSIPNSFNQHLQNPQGSIQSPQSSENDFVPGQSAKKGEQVAATKSKPEPVNQASSIQSAFATSDFGGSPSQQLVKQVGFVEPIVTPVKQEDAVVPFEAGKVVAIVGGEPIFVGDMIFEINQVLERFIAKAPEDVKERERQKMIPQILPKFVESRLLYHGMLKKLPEGVDVEDVLTQAGSEFDTKAMPQLMEAAGVESVTEFDAYLRSLGSSLRNMRHSWARDQMTRFFLSQEISVNDGVTHQEMLKVYRENFDSYALIAKARWEQIMIRFDRSDSREAARSEIEKLSSQIVHGANLAALAKKSSHGFLASAGGQQDWTSKNALVLKEIDEAIFTLPTGALSSIIETKDGFHIVRVIERTEAGHTSFLEAQVDIKKEILAKKRKAAYDKHLAELREQIPVEYMINDDAIAKLNAKNKHR